MAADAESETIDELSTSAVITRDEVWDLSSGIVQVDWYSADDALAENVPGGQIAKIQDPVTVEFNIGGSRLLAYGGSGRLKIAGSDITFARTGRASSEFEIVSSATDDDSIGDSQWPCDLAKSQGCFYTVSSSDFTDDLDANDYVPDSITLMFELVMVVSAAAPLAVMLGRRRPWMFRPPRNFWPLAGGAFFVLAGTAMGYATALVPNVYMADLVYYAASGLTTFSLAAVIVLYIAFGSIRWIRFVLCTLGTVVAATDVIYLAAGFRVSAVLIIVTIAMVGATYAATFLLCRRQMVALSISAVTAAFTFEFNDWTEYRQKWFGRLPYAFQHLHATWVPLGVALVSVAIIEEFISRSGLRKWRTYPLFYVLAAALAVVPGLILHLNTPRGSRLYVVPYDYWLAWWAVLSVFFVCAAIKVSVLGRSAECYRLSQLRRLCIAVTTICCMMLFYGGYTSQYKSGVVALVATLSLVVALPTRGADEAIKLAGTTRAVHREAVTNYVRARSFLTAYRQLRREEVAKLASGDLSLEQLTNRSEELLSAVEQNGGVAALVRARVFGPLVDESPLHAGIVGALIGLVASIPIVAFDLTGLPENFLQSITQIPLITTVWQTIAVERWVVYGFIFGFFYPMLRGHTPTMKAWWLALALMPTELVLAWISNYDVQPGTLLLAAGENLAFFLVLAAAWEIRLVARSGIAWTDVRSLRGARGVLAPLGAVAVAAVTAAVPILTSTVAPTSPQQAQQQVQVGVHSSSGGPTAHATAPAEDSQSNPAWPTGSETVLPCPLLTGTPSSVRPSPSPTGCDPS